MEPQYAVTMHSLHKWHDSVFERLGWMVLARTKLVNHNSSPEMESDLREKLSGYHHGLKNLRAALQEKAGSVKEEDRKTDLLILHQHVTELLTFFEGHLALPQKGGAKVSKKSSKKNSKRKH